MYILLRTLVPSQKREDANLEKANVMLATFNGTLGKVLIDNFRKY